MSDIYLGSLANVIDENGILWMSEYLFNSLFAYDIKAGEISYKGIFKNEDKNILYQHNNAFNYTDRIIFTPLLGSSIGIYTKSKGTFDSISVPKVDSNEEFFQACRLNENIFFASNKGQVFRYNVVNNHLVADIELAEEMAKSFDLTHSSISQCDVGFVVVDNNKIFLVNVVELSIKMILDWSSKQYVLGEAYLFDNYLWITLKNNQMIFLYDQKNNEVTSYYPENESWLLGRNINPYSLLKKYNGHVLISNFYCNHISYIDKKNKLIKFIPNLQSYKVLEKNGYGPVYYAMHEYDGDLYFIPTRGNVLLKVNRSMEIIYSQELLFNSKDFKELEIIRWERLKREAKNGVVKEQALVCLEDFVKEIVEG